jgi:hypothetical protein
VSYGLGAVAMVQVDIKDDDTLDVVRLVCMSRGDEDIVDEAKATGRRGGTVMPWRSYRSETDPALLHDLVNGLARRS